MRTAIPGWAIEATWWASSVFATGAVWYFLSINSYLYAGLSFLGAIGFFIFAVFLRRKKDASALGSEDPRPPRMLPKQAEHFTGRVADIDWLIATLRSERRVALIGAGGIGKTAIAQRALMLLSPSDAPFANFPGGIYAHDFYAAPSYLAALESIVSQAGLADLDDREREPRARVLLGRRKCLIYLEGCEKAEDLPRFLKLCGTATVLLTSRRVDDSKGAATRHIGPLDPSEAAEMLCRHAMAGSGQEILKCDDKAVWQEIAVLLGRHALALRLAGFRLGHDNETPAEFRDRLKVEGFERFDDDRRSKESLDLLFIHSAEALSLPARAAWYSLALCALSPIHIAPVAAALDLDERGARKALNELAQDCLVDAVRMPSEIRGTTESGWVLSHALLREWGRRQRERLVVEPEAIFSRWEKWWLRYLEKCFFAQRVPGGPARYTAVSDHFEALLENAAAFNGEAGQTLTIALVGKTHLNMGRYTAAEGSLRRGLAISEEMLGHDHPATIASLNDLVNVLTRKSDIAAAEPLCERARKVSQRKLGPEHPITLESLSNYGNLLYTKRDLARAEVVDRQMLETRSRVLGPEHPDTLKSLNNVATVLRDKGDLDAAEPLYRRALEARDRLLGAEHPATLTSCNNFAILLYDKGKLTESEPLFRRALETSEMVLGPEHPETLNLCKNLAVLLISKHKGDGDFKEAETLLFRAVRGFRRLLAPEHSWRKNAEIWLAKLPVAYS